MSEKMVKIWFIQNQNGKGGFWSKYFIEDFSETLSCMENEDVFIIKCKVLTKEEFNELKKNSREFEGW